MYKLLLSISLFISLVVPGTTFAATLTAPKQCPPAPMIMPYCPDSAIHEAQPKYDTNGCLVGYQCADTTTATPPASAACTSADGITIQSGVKVIPAQGPSLQLADVFYICSNGAWFSQGIAIVNPPTLGSNYTVGSGPSAPTTKPRIPVQTPIDNTNKFPISGPQVLCPDIYVPVCGIDNITYPNSCQANNKGVAVVHAGSCTDASIQTAGGLGKPVVGQLCPLIYAPVCGADGKTYPSACEARNHTTVSHTGSCDGSSIGTQPPLYNFTQATASTNPSLENARASIKRSLTFLDAAVTRGEVLVDRIRSRISKFGDKNTAAASGYATTAASELATARSILVELELGIDSATGANPADAFGNARNAIHDVNMHLKNAMNAITLALRSLPTY